MEKNQRYTVTLKPATAETLRRWAIIKSINEDKEFSTVDLIRLAVDRLIEEYGKAPKITISTGADWTEAMETKSNA